MPDLRRTRKKIKTALGILVGVDVVAIAILFSPLVEPLTDLPRKVLAANRQIADFYNKRFPSRESEILTSLGKRAVDDGVTIEQVKYKVLDSDATYLHPVEMEADLSGTYVSLAKFINALERDDMFFIINSISLAGEQKGPIKLQMKLETYLKVGK
jgi:type IV pilus assembly protein PilO